MNDEEILDLYWTRQEKAIYETDKKYGKYCNTISFNILQNNEEAKECVNDTYLKAWNNIPPKRPNVLKIYLGRITRNLAINQYEKRKAKKRDYTLEVALEELNECVSSKNNVEEVVDYNELVNVLNTFLSELSENKRKIFLERYWYLYSIKEISSNNKISESNVKVILMRLRKELKDYLKEGGIL
ncbi:MAG: sigma-70 family RNA polymerase sigma factor [Clostridia bacterium]|nr:sigma-70 family RNA polymerase sigma factor [Clostridia bacterium]